MAFPKPPLGAIARGSPWVEFLVSAFLLQEGPSAWVDYVNPANTAVTSGAPIIVTNQLAAFPGGGLFGGGASCVHLNSGNEPPNDGSEYTVLIRFTPKGIGGGFGGHQCLYGNNSFSIGLFGNKFGWYNYSGSTADLVDNTTYTIGFRRSIADGGVSFWLDGVLDSFHAGLGVVFPASDLNPLGIGGTTSHIQDFIGDIDYVYIFRALPEAAIPIITADPFALFASGFEDGVVSQPLTWEERHTATPEAISTVDLNDRTTYYLGYKAPRVDKWGLIERGLSGLSGQIEHMRASTLCNDEENHYRGELGVDATKWLMNRPNVRRMIDDEDRRREGLPMIVMNGFVSNYAPELNKQFLIESVGWLRKSFTRKRKSQLAWQPTVRLADFDPNTTPSQVLNRPAPFPYNPDRDDDLQTVPDTDRSTGYLPDPTLGTPVPTGSPANPVTKRFLFTGLNGFYGDPFLQKITDHRGETLAAYVDQLVPDDQELRDQVNAGVASVYCDFPITCPDAAAVRCYESDTNGANVKYLGLADDLGGGSFNFTYGKSSISGGPLYIAGQDAKLPLRNNTYLPGSLTGGNVTTDTGSGKNLLLYVGLRLCLDGVHRAEFLAAACAVAGNFALYVGGVRVDDAELDAYFTVQGRASWLTAWTPFTRQYFEIYGRRYATVLADRGYAKARGLVSEDELSAGETPLTANYDGIEDVGDATGAPIRNLFLIALHFAENCLAASGRPVNAQNWVGNSPIEFTAIPGLALVDRQAFLDMAAAYPEFEGDGVGGVLGAFQEEVTAEDAMARLALSGDFQWGENRLGQLTIKREPDTIPDDMPEIDDVINTIDQSFKMSDGVLTEFFNILPYRYGRDLSGRSSGGPAFVRGSRIVTPETDGWASTAAGDFEMTDEASQFLSDQVKVGDQIDLHFLSNRTLALKIVSRVLLRYVFPFRRVIHELPLSGTRIDLGDHFRTTNKEGIGTNGYVREPMRTLRHALDCNEYKTMIEAYPTRDIIGRVVAPYTFDPVTTVNGQDFVVVP